MRIHHRVGPLIEWLRQPDPDPELTARILETLSALKHGGAAIQQATLLTPGARRDFAGGIGNLLDGMANLAYISAENVSGRGIQRHAGPVARIVYYSLTTGAGRRTLMVHVTAEGLVTDLDLVDK